MNNRLEKFLAFVSGVLLLVVVILGIKIKDDERKTQLLVEDLLSSPDLANINKIQSNLNGSREVILGSAARKSTKTVTTDQITKMTTPPPPASAPVVVAKPSSPKKTKTS